MSHSFHEYLQEIALGDGLPRDCADEFAAWAYGDVTGQTAISTFGDRWNERHGELFKVSGGDSRDVMTRRMFQAWKDAGKPGTA